MAHLKHLQHIKNNITGKLFSSMIFKYLILYSDCLIVFYTGYSQNNVLSVNNTQPGRVWNYTYLPKLEITCKDSSVIQGKFKNNDSILVSNNNILKNKNLYVGFDAFKGLLNEYSLNFGYNTYNSQFINISVGYTVSLPVMEIFKLIDQYVPANFYYQGPTFRVNYEFHSGSREINYPFFGLDVLYKYLFFNNAKLYNELNDGFNGYYQNEVANEFGWHLNCGSMFNGNHFFYYISIGLGETINFRNYTIFNSYYFVPIGYTGSLVRNGNYSGVQHNFSIIISFIIGHKF